MKLDVIIDQKLRAQMDSNSLEIFSSIAYQCLQDDRRQRPQMRVVVEELEDALEYQEKFEFEKNKELLRKSITDTETDTDAYWEQKLPRDYEDIIKRLDSPVVFANKKELFSLLRQGILFNGGTRLFGLDDNGGKCEMVAATEFAGLKSQEDRWKSIAGTRFPVAAEVLDVSSLSFVIQVKPRFLSTGIMYGASLVFRIPNNPKITLGKPMNMEIRCDSVNKFWISQVAEWIDDEWMAIELWHFISHKKNLEFEITLDISSCYDGIIIEGIKFQPLHTTEDEERIALEDDSLNDDTEWEKKLPSDYQKIIARSNSLNYTSKKELYLLLREGILIDNGIMWFAISKLNGKKCHALPAIKVLFQQKEWDWEWKNIAESRFRRGAERRNYAPFTFKFKIRSDMLTKGAAYSCYLICKCSDARNELVSGAAAKCELNGEIQGLRTVHFTPKSKMLKPKNEMTSHESSTVPHILGLPKQRKDGWIEVLLWEFTDSSVLNGNPELYLEVTPLRPYWNNTVVEGIEFRPI